MDGQPQPTPSEVAAWEARRASLRRWGGPELVEHPAEHARESAALDAERDHREEAERQARGSPREILRAAHQRRGTAAARVIEERNALERAHQHFDVSRTELDVAERAAAAQDDQAVQAALVALRAGKQPPAAPEPSSPVGQHLERARASHAHAKAALEIVEGELRRAESAHMGAQRLVAACSGEVLIAQGLAVADKIAALEAELATLRQSLTGLDIVWVNGKPLQLPRRLARAFPVTSRAEAVDRWNAAMRALADDPTSAFP